MTIGPLSIDSNNPADGPKQPRASHASSPICLQITSFRYVAISIKEPITTLSISLPNSCNTHTHTATVCCVNGSPPSPPYPKKNIMRCRFSRNDEIKIGCCRPNSHPLSSIRKQCAPIESETKSRPLLIRRCGRPNVQVIEIIVR